MIINNVILKKLCYIFYKAYGATYIKQRLNKETKIKKL